MQLLLYLSVGWTILCSIILFYYLIDSRFSDAKKLRLTICILGPLGISNAFVFAMYGTIYTLKVIPVTFILPAYIFYYLTSKHQDSKLSSLFTALLTIILEILIITNLIEHYFFTGNYVFTFLSRLFIFPVLVYFVKNYLKEHMYEIQNKINSGWVLCTFNNILLSIVLLSLFAYPTIIYNRPSDLYILIYVLIFIPLYYTYSIQHLMVQKQLSFDQQEEQLRHLELIHLRQRIQQLSESEKHIRLERHNMRHRIQTLIGMLKKNEIEDACKYLEASNQQLDETITHRWCANHLLDAVFSIYFTQAKSQNIKIEASIDLPEILSINEAELSIVFANALENAIHASLKLPEEQRYIKVTCLTDPQFMFSISNNFDGNINFDDKGHPMSTSKNHGFGTQSIVSFCNKNHAYYDYKVIDNKFTLRILIN